MLFRSRLSVRLTGSPAKRSSTINPFNKSRSGDSSPSKDVDPFNSLVDDIVNRHLQLRLHPLLLFLLSNPDCQQIL